MIIESHSALLTSSEVKELGIFSDVWIVHNIVNKKSALEYDVIKKDLFKSLYIEYNLLPFSDDPVLWGYRDVRNKLEAPGNKYAPSPEKLVNLLLKRTTLPSINLLVDICNCVSLQSRLSIGIHQLDKIGSGVKLELTKGDELFIPLGAEKPHKIKKGEFAYIDNENNILCRYDSVQCDRTKVSESTASAMIIVRRERPDAIVLDIMLPGLDGFVPRSAMGNERAHPDAHCLGR